MRVIREVSWWRWAALGTACAVIGAGLAGFALARRAPAPAREQITEFFDPDCGYSREAHRRLVHVLDARPEIQHELVPIALTRGVKYTRADLLCALEPAEARRVARRWSESGLGEDLSVAFDPERIASCPEEVERNTQRAANLLHPPALSSPVVTFRNRVYRGLPEVEALLQDVSKGSP